MVLVMLVATVVGGLLNAPGIRKTANAQPVGITRDLARLVAEPLYEVSHLLRIDQFRRALQAATGRSGDDDIDTTLPGPVAPDPTTTSTMAPAKRAFSPTDRMLVWVGGDSLAVTPGQSFVAAIPGTEVAVVVGNAVDGRVATGLARPELFNWPQHMLEVIAQDDPDVVVLTLGSNDDQILTGDRGVGPFGSGPWIDEYRRRIGGMMDTVTADRGRTLVWLGVPIMRNEERSETRYRVINDIIREEATKRPGRVFYVDLYDRFTVDGGYADFVDGVQVRTPDGIHFSRDGGNAVAQMVIDQLGRMYDLTSWRTAPPTTIPLPRPTTTTAPPATGKAPTTGRSPVTTTPLRSR
ncbi:MAG: DUF459 domain-containing protein [Actinobacteria bacterium]|nr:DUF459 domain-containing protein [Actinomycetota bacterium]